MVKSEKIRNYEVGKRARMETQIRHQESHKKSNQIRNSRIIIQLKNSEQLFFNRHLPDHSLSQRAKIPLRLGLWF